MTRSWWPAVALGLLAAACAPLPTMVEYCAESGACECADGVCCSVGHQACDADVPCCAGMECAPEGICVLEGPVPTVTLSPSEIDFGWVSADATPPIQELVIANVGTTATRPLEVELESAFEGSFLLDPGDCAAAALAPGATCTATITFVPAGQGMRMRAATVRLREAPAGLPSRDLGAVPVSGQAGHELTVSVLGDSAVSVAVGALSPVNIPAGQQHVLWRPRPWTAILDAPGHHPVRFSPGTFTTFPIEVDVPARLTVQVSAEPNLVVTVQAGPKASVGNAVFVTIRWMMNGEPWQRTCSPGAACRIPAAGPVSLTYAPGIYTGPYAWTGACAGTTGDLCQLDIAPGRTDVGLTTD